MSNTLIDDVVQERTVQTPVKLRLIAYKQLTKAQQERFDPPWPPHVFEFGTVKGDASPFRIALMVSNETVAQHGGDPNEAAWQLIGMELGKQLVEASQFGTYLTGLCVSEEEEDTLCETLSAVQDAKVPTNTLLIALRALTEPRETAE